MADQIQTNILIRVLDAFTAPLKVLKGGIEDVSEVSARAEKRFQLAANLNQAAQAAGSLSSMIRAPLEDAVNEFRGFEKQMSEVQALADLQAGDSGLAKLKDQALELGAATAYSAQEAAAAQAQYAQAGRSVNEILQITPMTLAAAKANGTGLAETAAIIGHTMSGMGIATSDTARVVDVLTAATAASDLKLDQLGQALAYVAPVARQSGMSLEMTAAFIGKLKDAGLEASSAGTGLRAVISRLLDPSKEATKAFAQLGLKAPALKELQRAVATGHLDEALRKIGTAADKLPNEKRMALLSQIFGLEASSAANIAITASMDVTEKGLGALNDKLHQVDGTANRLAGVMGDNLDGDIERATGAISGLKTAVGEALAPAVSSAMGSVEGLAGTMTTWVGKHPEATKATLELVAGLGGLAAGLRGILLGMSAYQSALGAMDKTYAALSKSMLGSVGLVFAAGAAGVAVGTWARETFDLDNQISELLGRPRGGELNQTGSIDEGTRMVLRGGWELDRKTGQVLKEGTAETAPKAVQRAREAGAWSRRTINEYIRKENETLRDRAEDGADALKQPGIPIDRRSKLEQLSDKVVPKASPLIDDTATREQTDALLETLRKQEGYMKQIAEATKRSYTPSTRPSGVPGT